MKNGVEGEGPSSDADDSSADATVRFEREDTDKTPSDTPVEDAAVEPHDFEDDVDDDVDADIDADAG